MDNNTHLTAFSSGRLVATGPLETTLRTTKAFLDSSEEGSVLIFDDSTGEQVDFNFQGSADQVVERATRPAPRRGPGRPRLGVVSREISLLPRHWEWLDNQPHSASATIRRLVEAARKDNPMAGGSQRRLEAAGRFMWAIAGDFANFEEASRALYARDWLSMEKLISDWPVDIRSHLMHLVELIDTEQSNS